MTSAGGLHLLVRCIRLFQLWYMIFSATQSAGSNRTLIRPARVSAKRIWIVCGVGGALLRCGHASSLFSR